MITTDHTGRKIEPQVIDLTGSGMSLTGSMACSGRLKAAQTYIRMMMTSPGHYPADRTFGGGFLDGIAGQSNMSNADIINRFATANMRVLDEMTRTLDGRPPDETITDAKLAGIIPSGGRFSVAIEISFADSGDSAVYLFPVDGSALLQP